MTNRGCDRPAERDLNNHIIPEVADKWRDIGVELLDANSTKALDIIERDHQNDTKTCCRQMFKKWLDTQENASWDQLLEALRSRSVQLNTLANKIENMLLVNVTPPATYTSSIDYSDCHDITEGFTLLVAELAKVLESANFPALKRAFKLRIPGGVQLPDDLKAKIKEAKELDDLLEALFESKYWNFADLRLVGVLVMSSGIREAKTVVDKYKEVFFSTKLVDVLNVCTHTVLPPNQRKEYVCRVGSKISKEPDEITVADLAQYCTALETVIMDINEGSCVLEHAEKGCIELHWLIPIHCSYHAYKSALNNRHKFHNLHLQYLKIETYPVIYDQFTIQPTVLSTLLCSPNPVVSTPAEVIGHYYCFLVDNLSNDTFCQIMSSLQLLKEDDRVTLSMLPSEYQRNTSLLNRLLVSNTTDIRRFCHTLRDAENQNIGYMLMNAIQSIPTDNDMGESLHSESGSYQQTSTKVFNKDGEISALPSEMILASKSVQLKFLNTIAHVNTILEKCDSRVFLKACNKLYAYVRHSRAEPLLPSDYITNLDATEDILKKLSFLWSWHNCSVLRALLEACNCQDGLSLLDEFESQIDLNQPMELFPIPRLSSKMAPSSSSTYTVLSIRSEQYHNQLVPLQYMREVATTLEQMFGISQHALQLLAVRPAPLILYWMIPNTVVALIGKEIHQHTSALRDNGFLEITAYPNIALFPRDSLSFSLLSYDHPQDISVCVTSSEDKSKVGMKIEQAKSANLQSELSTKIQELEKLKMKERKLAALYSQSKVELYKVERGLTSGIEWLSTVPLKLCSETEIKIDTIEAKLSRNITTLSRLQSILDEKQWSNKNIDLTGVKPVHELKGMEKKGLKLGVEMSGEEMLNTLKSEPRDQFKSKDSSQKEILDTDKKGSNDDQKDTNQHHEMELDKIDVGTLDVIPDGKTKDDKPNMADLHSKVIHKQFAINWERLGLKLGLSNDQMEIISYNHKHSPNRTQDCCTAMFKEWLRVVPSPTWGKLSDAINEIMTGDDIDISTGIAYRTDLPADHITEEIKSQCHDKKASDTLITDMKLLYKIVIPKISAYWIKVLAYLQYPISFKKELDKKHRRDPQSCCTDLLEDWIATDRGIGPKTYTTLMEVLYSIPETVDHAEDIKTQLSENGVTVTITKKLHLGLSKKRPGKEKSSTPPWTPNEPTLTLAGETFTFSADDLEDLGVLAAGTYGVVSKMKHIPTKMLMAMKRIPLYKLSITGEDKITKFFAQTLHRTCPYIVDYYGYLIREGELWICIELMDTSMDHIFKKVYQVLNQTIPEEMIGKIAVAVVNALHYLKKDLNLTYEVMRSSNILLNKNGDIKFCDLSLLVHSTEKVITPVVIHHDTHYGAFYMAPEKINPSVAREECTDKFGVWSFGITLMELALGEFPYKVQKNTFEQLNAIVNGDSPKLSREKFSRELCDFVAACLIKDPIMRPGYDQLLMSDYVVKHTKSKYDVAEWFKQFIQYL